MLEKIEPKVQEAIASAISCSFLSSSQIAVKIKMALYRRMSQKKELPGWATAITRWSSPAKNGVKRVSCEKWGISER